MSTPIVVQGQPVANPYVQSGVAATATDQIPPENTGAVTKGEKQENKCRDPIFAFLLYANLAAIIAVAAIYGPDAFDDVNNSGTNYEGYIWTVLVTGAASLGFTALMLYIMMRIPETMIKVSLIFTVIASAVWAVLGFLSGQYWIGILGCIFFAIGVCYARAVWSRIPFATANLITASTAIKNNCGVTLIAYAFGILAFAWSFCWGIAFAGLWNLTYNCDEVNGEYVNCTDPNYGYLFLLFVAYYFMHQVLQNCVHVSVAGVVGTWWFDPEEGASCCSSAVTGSFIRTMTTSFGSICFGSLIVAILEGLKALANAARSNDDGGVLVCIAECILGCLANLVEYFNKWAFVYVGLYGYGYLEAGKNVFTLFKNRGWEAIIADDLVGNALGLTSLITGALSGCVGLIVEASTDWLDDAPGSTLTVAFILGFIVGLVICSILVGTIGSGVNTVIVLFAEAPAEFEENYPDLSQQMREAYRTIYPGSV